MVKFNCNKSNKDLGVSVSTVQAAAAPPSCCPPDLSLNLWCPSPACLHLGPRAQLGIKVAPTFILYKEMKEVRQG